MRLHGEGLRATLSRVSLAVWLLTALTGLGILLWPEGDKRALVPRDGWEAEGAFVANLHRPPPLALSRSILTDRQSVFWSSWIADPGGGAGRVMSHPFQAPSLLAVPFSGFPRAPGGELYLECLESGRRLHIAHGNVHYTWVERTLWLPRAWCRSESRLVAKATGEQPNTHIAVANPFASTLLAWLKESVFVLVFLHALACVLLVAPGFAIAWLFGGRRVEAALVAALPVTLLAGYVAFFGFYYQPAALRYAVAVGMAGSVLVTVLNWRAITTWLRGSPVAGAGRLFFVLSLSYVLLLYSGDLGLGTFTANSRFAPAVWSTDNQLVQIVAEGLYQRDTIRLGNWHVSDRPPLLTGMFLLDRPVWAPLKAIGENSRFLFYFYQVTGVVASTLWVLPVWLLLVRSRATPRAAALVVLALAAMGVVVFNSVYIWPKMLSGALALSAYLVYTAGEADDIRSARVREVATGTLLGLALVAHSGVVFGLVPVWLAFFMVRATRRVRGPIVALAIAAIVLAPWVLWQRFEDPPGNALVKFALAGTYGLGEETKSLVATVREAYGRLTLPDWIVLRSQAVSTLFGAFQPPSVQWLWSQPMDYVGQLRLSDFAFLFPSLRLGNLGWLVVAVALVRARREALSLTESHWARWVLLGLAGVALNALVLWTAHVTWTTSYLSLLFLVTGLYASLLLKGPWLRRLVLLGQFGYFVIVWWWSPLASRPWRDDVVAGWVVSLVGLWLAVPPAVAVTQTEGFGAAPAPIGEPSLGGSLALGQISRLDR